MDMEWLDNLSHFFGQKKTLILFTIGLISIYILVRTLASKLIKRQARQNHISYDREAYMRKLINVLLVVITITILGALWEISLKGLSLYFASVLTVIGVALFATWSVLGNLTSFIFLFFFFPYRIGQRVRIVDGDNTLEGLVMDISLFYMRIETDEKDVVAYPNNLVIQKAIIIRSK